MILPIADAHERAAVRTMQDIILDEINVKEIEYVTDETALVKKKAKPNFKTLGPKFGKSVQQVAARVREMSGAEIASLERSGGVALAVGDQLWTVNPEDVEILREDMPGWLVESDGTLTVALDTRLDEALLAEGSAREFVNRVQNLRKDAGFAVTDRIRLGVDTSSILLGRLESMRTYIMSETLAEEFSATPANGGQTTSLDINGEQLTVSISRVMRG
jgi:isoleucyl-tRNA synthetase